MAGEPSVFKDLMCYKREKKFSEDEYFSVMRKEFYEDIAWPTLQT